MMNFHAEQFVVYYYWLVTKNEEARVSKDRLNYIKSMLFLTARSALLSVFDLTPTPPPPPPKQENITKKHKQNTEEAFS